MKLHLLIWILFLVGSYSRLYAQDATSASGGNAVGSNGSVSYTVGQVVYTTQTGSTGSVAQGVQQPYEIYQLSGAQFTAIKVSILAYPNPTQSALTLDILNQDIDQLNYSLVDIQGRLVMTAQIIEPHTLLLLENLPTATYILKISSHNKEIKTFKIIKN